MGWVLLVQFYTVQCYNQLKLVYFQAALIRSSLVCSPLLSSIIKERGEVRRGEVRRGEVRSGQERREKEKNDAACQRNLFSVLKARHIVTYEINYSMEKNQMVKKKNKLN